MLSPDALPLSLYRPPIVLVVESRSRTRSALCRLLRALGYDGRPARDGQQALRMLAQHPSLYQLVLANVLLPDMDGGELAQQVAQAWPGTRVMVTAEYVPIGRPAAVLAAHADLPVLRRPFGFRELYEAVCSLVGPPRAAVPLMARTGTRSRRRTRVSVP